MVGIRILFVYYLIILIANYKIVGETVFIDGQADSQAEVGRLRTDSNKIQGISTGENIENEP